MYGRGEPDMRIGWLLWQDSLREFLYFEYPMAIPNSDDYWAEWHESKTRGRSRKGSKNLWIFHKAAKQKRYSVTTEAGIKIQPYFDVPPPNDPNLYRFIVQGEGVEANLVRLWITVATARELRRLIGELDPARLSELIVGISAKIEASAEGDVTADMEAQPIMITKAAYIALVESFEGVSDEHRIQLLTAYLRENN